MSFCGSRMFTILVVIVLALSGIVEAFFIISKDTPTKNEYPYEEFIQEEEQAYDLAWHLIDLMKEMNYTYSLTQDQALEFVSSKKRLEKIEDKLGKNCSAIVRFTPIASAIANKFKMKCEIKAKISISTSGMTPKQYVDFKQKNLNLFESLVESQAQCREAEKDLETLTASFVFKYRHSFTKEQKQDLKSHLHNCLSEKIGRNTRILHFAKERSKVKLPVLAWSYMKLNDFLDKSDEGLLNES